MALKYIWIYIISVNKKINLIIKNMKIIPQAETPCKLGLNELVENLAALAEAAKRITSDGISEPQPQLIVEQNSGTSALVSCAGLLEKRKDIKLTYAFNMRDKNRISILSDLKTLKQIGIRRVLISEGTHPIKTAFGTAKPVYDVDAVSVAMALKSDFTEMMFGPSAPSDEISGFFEVSAMVQASIPADLWKIKKLVKAGVDEFIVDNKVSEADKDILGFLKSENKKIFLFAKEAGIAGFPESLAETAAGDIFDGIIVKVQDVRDNVFFKHAVIDRK